jgi:hypothetical protein
MFAVAKFLITRQLIVDVVGGIAAAAVDAARPMQSGTTANLVHGRIGR